MSRSKKQRIDSSAVLDFIRQKTGLSVSKGKLEWWITQGVICDGVTVFLCGYGDSRQRKTTIADVQDFLEEVEKLSGDGGWEKLG